MSAATPTLRTLAEDKTPGVNKTNSTFRVDPHLIKFQKGFNLRAEGPELDEHIERLYQAYKAGDQVPAIDVIVVKDNVVARDGHCRTQAAKRVRKEMPEFTIECRQFRGNDVDAVVHMLGTGTGSKPLTPLEAGKGYLRLIKMGLTPAQIAEKLHVSRPTIDNGVALAEAPAEVQGWGAAGKVSATTARKIVKQGAKAVTALKEAVEKKETSPDKKKKVTQKHLKGTAASPKNVKKEVTSSGGYDFTITFKKADVVATLKYLQSIKEV